MARNSSISESSIISGCGSLLGSSVFDDSSSSHSYKLESIVEIQHAPVPFLFPTADDKTCASKCSQLTDAILNEDHPDQIQVIKLILKDICKLNERDPRGRTPLMYAICAGNISMIKILIKCQEIDLKAHDRFGNTTIMYAAGHGYAFITEILLEWIKSKSCDQYWPNDMLTLLYAENYDGDTAFTLALAGDHDDCIEILSKYFRDALDEDEKRKGSFMYRIGDHLKKHIQSINAILKERSNENCAIKDQQCKRDKRRASSQDSKSPLIFTSAILTAPSETAINLITNYGKNHRNHTI